MSQQCVLVTGGSGFIAGHCILQLLEQGYLVRTTVRSLTKEASTRSTLEHAGMVHGNNLSFAAADLLSNEGWEEAMVDTDFVLHVASPVQPGHVAQEDDLIIPALEGTLRVLRAARSARVKRVVLTSAFHAVSWGHPHRDNVFTEDDWTILDGPGVDAYGKSKTMSERAAWDFMNVEGGEMELTSMLPVAVIGPILGKNLSGSNHLIQRMLTGGMPAFPNLFIPIIDVRDVASAHLLAMTNPAAAGERFLLSNGRALQMQEIGTIIKKELGDAAKLVPNRTIPNFVLRIASLFNTELKPLIHDLGYAKKTTNEKARQVLGWKPRAPDEAIIAAATSMVKSGAIEAP